MTIEETAHLEETILIAARNLAAHQQNIVRADSNYRKAFQKRQAAEAVCRDTQSALREVELRHARSVCAFLEAVNVERDTSSRRRDLDSEHYQALKLLMKVCGTGDRSSILNAAHKFSSTNSALNEASYRDSEACFNRAMAEMAKNKAEEELKAARKKLEDAEAEVTKAKAAEQLCWGLIPSLPRNICKFQNAVAEAAAALNGAVIVEAFTPFDTSDLGIELPEDTGPKADSTLEPTAPSSQGVTPSPLPCVSQQTPSSVSVSTGFGAQPFDSSVKYYFTDRDDTRND